MAASRKVKRRDEMDEFFDPETMLITDEFLQRYEQALFMLPERELWVWLMHRKGMPQREIARRLNTYQKRVDRMLKRVRRKLKRWCLYGIWN